MSKKLWKGKKHMWMDINSGMMVSREQLYNEYVELRKAQPDEYCYSFDEYIENCTGKNGQLVPIWNTTHNQKGG